MQENFGVNIVFNVKDGSLKNANASINSLNNQVNMTQKSVSSLNNTFQNTFFTLGSLNLAFGAIKASITSTITSALSLASANEQLKNSLASLISLNHSSVDAKGRAISANEKWNASLKLSEETIKKLNVINLKTIYTLQDVSAMFKSFYSTAGANMSLSEAISAMEAIALAAQVSGASADSLKMTLDSLGAGIAQTQTDFGRFVSSLGLTTEAMSKAKAEGKLYSLIIEKLGSFAEDAKRSANTYEASLSNLTNALDELKQKAIEPYFDGIKKAINATSEAISNNQDLILNYLGVMLRLGGSIAISMAAIKGLNLALSVIAPLKAYALGLKGIAQGANIASASVSALKTILARFGPTAGVFAILEAWSRWNEYIKDTRENLNSLNQDGLENKLEDAKKRLKIASEGLERVRKEGGFVNKFKEQKFLGDYSKAFKEVQDLENRLKNLPKTKTTELKLKDGSSFVSKDFVTKNIKDASLAYEQMARVGLSEYNLALLDIIDKTQKWVDAGVNLNDALQTQNILIQDLESKQALKELNAELDLRAEEIALGNDSLEKSIKLEKLRYEKTMANLNARVAKEVELGEMSLSFANRLYELEEKKHKQNLKNIQEQYRFKSGFGEYCSQALNENFIYILNGGGFNNFSKSLQKSASQAFSRSLAKAFEDSRTGKAMNKAFDMAISSSIEGLGKAFDKVLGEDLSNSLSDALGGVLAGIGVAQASSDVITSLLPQENAKGAKLGGTIGGSAGSVIGAVVGSIIPGLGTALGGLIGGAGGGIIGTLIGGFYGKKTESIRSGIELFSKGNKNYLDAKGFEDKKETKNYFWGLLKKERNWTEYSDASSYALIQVKNTLRSFENLIADIGGEVNELSIEAGKYASYDALSDSVVSQVIKSVMSASSDETLNAVSKIWSDYAKSVNKSVSKAILDSLNSVTKSTESYTKWLYDFKGDTLGSARYSAEIAKKEVDRLQDALGVSGINVDNFLSFSKEALKNAFDPNTISLINSLGEAIQKSAQASQKYEEALKKENKTKLKMLDPFLKKTKSLQEAQDLKTEIDSKTNLKILSTLQKILKAQEMMSYGGVA